MTTVESSDRKRIYLPSLEGVRAYAFLVVFFAHYTPFSPPVMHFRPWMFPFMLVERIAWIAVPIFFVMSGYLIGGILYDTRDRKGFFRVFYCRRILRVFPVYYLTLLSIACLDSVHRISLNYRFWSDFLYIQNLLPGYISNFDAPPFSQTAHFWSLAIEEQFYLLWPLVVWFCPSRRRLIGVTVSLISLCCILRFSACWTHFSTEYCYVLTPTRVDAILLGVVLALIRHDRIYKRLERFAKYAALAGITVMMILVARFPLVAPTAYLLAACEISIVNLTSTAIIVAVLEEGSFLCQICSVRWICWLGSLTYGLYIFHYVYHGWFANSFIYTLAAYISLPVAYFVSTAIAFCLTLLLAVLSYRFIERPAMNLKSRIKYGPLRASSISQEATEPIFARIDS